jgi:hypothetical protein
MPTVAVSMVALVHVDNDETVGDATKRVDELVAFLSQRENRDLLRMLFLRPPAA